MKRRRLNPQTGLAVILVVTAAFIPVRAHALPDYTSPRNADVDARGARSIRVIAGAGSLRVEGRPGISQVQVRGTARASARNRLADIQLTAERRGDEVYIKAEMPDNGGRSLFSDMRDNWNDNAQLDLVIEVPQTIPLDVDDGSGESKFVNVGPLSFSDGSGEIDIRGVKGNLRVQDGSGNVTIENVEGSVRITDGSGNIRANNIVGDFKVDEDGSGDIDVTSVGGTMTVDSDGSGNIDVARVAGDFVVDRKGSGTIRSSDIRGHTEIPERHRRRG